MDAAHLGTRFRVRRVQETGSTNADVVAAAAAGEAEGLALVADHQTAGRGRLGRTWVAPPGSALLVSILLRPPVMYSHLAVATVACAACALAADAGARVKWPNDLVGPDGRKLAGVLAEANATSVVVGLGLNVHRSPDMPEELRATACALDELGPPAAVDSVLAALLSELEPRYARLCASGPSSLLAEYRRWCVTIGQRVRVEQAHGVWEGTAVDVDDDGALVVDASGVRQRVLTADVIHLRPVR